MSQPRGRVLSELRIWLFPLSILLGAALTVFVISVWFDAAQSSHPRSVLSLLIEPNVTSAQDTLGSAGQVVSGVLAIAITVVAIIVELASNRYTHRITELFVREPINFLVIGFFVVTTLLSLWVNLIIDYEPAVGGFVPYTAIGTSMVMLTLCLLILLPYFAFVFEFLNPISIVDRIRAKTLSIIAAVSSNTSVLSAQQDAVRGVEQLADVSLNAMEHKDKGVSMAGADALLSLVVEYQALRPRLLPGWFGIDGRLAHNPDFVSMSPEVLEDLRERRIWLEWKVLRAYQSLYNEALNRMRDINYLIAINTRLVASAAWDAGNTQLLDLVVKFFNTYLRSAINAHDIRTAYNVLNQYRLVAEESIDRDKSGVRAIEIAKYFKYYGQLSFNAKLPFILETVAYDICALTEHAFNTKSPATQDLLRIFLQVDKESENETQETSLRGVRKAQVKLASYFLLHGDERLAREVWHDMRDERPERLASIRDELLMVESREFWEVSDRGANFDYLDVKQKEELVHFFGWFGERLPPPRGRWNTGTSAPPMPGDSASLPPKSLVSSKNEEHQPS